MRLFAMVILMSIYVKRVVMRVEVDYTRKGSEVSVADAWHSGTGMRVLRTSAT